MNKKPNILLVVSDQHRGSAMGCAGNKQIRTPTLDKLASEGIRFTNAVSASPVCAPYRVTLQTGLYSHQHGVCSNESLLNQKIKGIGDYFSEAGYESCFVGKSHFGADPIPEKDGWQPVDNRFGWIHWKGTGGDHHYDTRFYDEEGNLDKKYYNRFSAEVRTDLAIEFLDKKEEGAWIMQVNYSEPHQATCMDLYEMPATREFLRGLNKKLKLGLEDDFLVHCNPGEFYRTMPQSILTQIVPEKYLEMYQNMEIQLDPNVREEIHTLETYMYKEYYAMVSALDHEIGRLLLALEDKNELEQTIILYTSDHGDMLGACGNSGRGKGVPYQNAFRVPMIVKGGAKTLVSEGMVVEALFNSVDLLPTLLELAGIEVPMQLPGISLAESIQGQNTAHQKDVLLGLGSWRAIFDGRFLYAMEIIEDFARPSHLIDTYNDPWDMDNLVKDSTHYDHRTHLQKRLYQRLLEEKDPWMDYPSKY